MPSTGRCHCTAGETGEAVGVAWEVDRAPAPLAEAPAPPSATSLGPVTTFLCLWKTQASRGPTSEARGGPLTHGRRPRARHAIWHTFWYRRATACPRWGWVQTC